MFHVKNTSLISMHYTNFLLTQIQKNVPSSNLWNLIQFTFPTVAKKSRKQAKFSAKVKKVSWTVTLLLDYIRGSEVKAYW